jgi:hypothetical protein
MANNEFFTNKYGEQVPVPDIRLPKDIVTSLMRLQEDYASRGRSLNLSGLALSAIIDGVNHVRASWKSAEKTKENRVKAGKHDEVAKYIDQQLRLKRPIDGKVVAYLSGIEVPEEVETIAETELTDSELDAATSPTGQVS